MSDEINIGAVPDENQVVISEILGAMMEPETEETIGDILDDAYITAEGLGDVSIGDVSIGSIFSKIAHSIKSAAKAVVHSPIVKMTAVGASFVFPPAVAASTALIAADRILAVADGKKKATPKAREEVKKAIAVTAEQAKAGNPEAQKAIEYMTLSRQLRAATGGKTVGPSKVDKSKTFTGPLVLPNNTIVRGTWLKVG